MSETSSNASPQPEMDVMVIYHTDHPEKRIDKETMDRLQLDLSLKMKSSDTKSPIYRGMAFRNGCIFINCTDTFSKTWLEKNVRVSAKALKISVDVKLVQPNIVEIVSDSYGLKKASSFLSLLKNQNENLKTDGWRVVGMRLRDKDTKMHLLVEVDNKSVTRLKEMKLKANISFDSAVFKIIEKDEEEKLRKKYKV